MSRHMSKFDPNILRPSNSGKHVDRLRSKCSNKWPYFVNSLPGPVIKQQATGARLMDQERMASATMTYAGLEEIEKDIMGPTVQQLMAVAQENSDGEGQFLEMLQSMGFKVVDPQDGSGQVHLIPPEGAAFEEGESSAGYEAKGHGQVVGQIGDMGEENAGQDGEDGASGMYVPEEEIMEEMMGDVMGDEEGYDEDQDEEDYEDDYEEEGDFDVIY
eukprot:gene26438-17534_t